MASPAVAATANTNITSASDPWTVNLPASIAAGDLLLIFLRGNNGNAAFASATPPSGWTALVNGENSDASNDVTHIIYRWADGAEGATVSVDMSSTCKGSAHAYRITGALDPATQAPEVSAVSITTAANADPNSVTPTGGSKDYLFIAFAGMDRESVTFTAAPSGYSGLMNGNSGTGGNADTNVVIGSAWKQATASSEDPGAFTNVAPTTGGTSYVVAIHPAAAGSAFSMTATGSITPTGVLVKATDKRMNGALTPAGVLAKATAKAFAGAVTPTGALGKLTSKYMSGSITPGGVLTRATGFAISLAGSITPTGALAKLTDKRMTGSITPSGVVRKATAKAFSGALGMTGVLSTSGGTPAPIRALIHQVAETTISGLASASAAVLSLVARSESTVTLTEHDEEEFPG